MAQLPLRRNRSTRARRTLSGHKRVFVKEELDRDSSLESPPCKKRKASALCASKTVDTNQNDNYTNFITNNLKHLMKDQSLSDVTFELNGELVYGNRCLFAAHSEVFKSMLYGNMMESSMEHNVIINDIELESFKYLRNTFYGIYDEEPYLNASIVVDVLFAAEKYLIGPLIEKCINFILQLKNVNDWYLVLKQFSNCSFQSQSKMYLNQILNNNNHENQNQIINNNREPCYILHYKAKQFTSDQEFVNLHHDILLIILSSDQLAIEEHVLWTNLIKWCEHNCESDRDPDAVKNALSDFIPLIRFSQMDTSYFREHIVQQNFLSKEDVIDIMFNRENPKQYKLTKFNSIPRISPKDLNTFELDDVCLSFKEICNLKVGDLVDFRDYYGLFCSATIVDVKHNENRLKVHYNNWSVSYDEWVVYNADDYKHDGNCDNNCVVLNQKHITQRFARYASVTERKIQRECFAKKFKDGSLNTNCNDECQVNLPLNFFKKNQSYIDSSADLIGKWLNANIVSHRTSKKYSDHVKVSINIKDESYEYWVHPDNATEIRPI